jgi:glycosyltransferase involved in cell wall biosynthesis
MKVLIINYTDIYGGAGRAAYRLHKSLLGAKIDSQMLVLDKKSDDYTVLAPESNFEKLMAFFKPRIEQFLIRNKYKNKSKMLFSSANLSSNKLIKKINSINPDVVHLHWINEAMLKIEDLVKIKAPIVWSLHDMWAFTGGCHYTDDCLNYLRGCGSCPIISSDKLNDASRKIFKRKQKTYTQKEITIVGLSKWINEQSKNSMLLKDKKHLNLPNSIDTHIYKPLDKQTAREVYNLPKDKKLVLFGAIKATSDLRKGFSELQESLVNIQRNDIELVVFGSSKPKIPPKLAFKTHYLGILSDDASLALLYSAVDIIVVPSKQENLSNIIMESLSCSTPVVAFDIGGNSDMIEHMKNGFLAKPFDIQDLAIGIDWVLNDQNYLSLCKNARVEVLDKFDSKIVANKYIQLYKNLLLDKNHYED